MGVGIGPAFTFMQASVGTCLPTLMMLPKLIGVKLTVAYLAFWLLYSVGERNPRWMDSVKLNFMLSPDGGCQFPQYASPRVAARCDNSAFYFGPDIFVSDR